MLAGAVKLGFHKFRKFGASVALGAVFLSGGFVATEPANAAWYSYSYFANSSAVTVDGYTNDSTVTASGNFGTTGNQITYFSGAINSAGLGFQTTGGNGIYGGFTPSPTFLTSPSGAFLYNNAVIASQPFLDQFAVLFKTAFSGEWNLWGRGPNAGSLYAGVGPGNYVVASDGTLTVTQTPLPAAVLLFGSGLLGLISLSRRKRAKRVVSERLAFAG